MNIAAVIMAAGSSRRMGQNKLLMDIKGETLLNRFLTNFPKDIFYKTVLVYADDEVGRIAESHGISVIKNTPGSVKNTTIMLGTEACKDADGIAFFTADQPFTKIGTVLNMVLAYKGVNIVVPTCEGRRRNPAIFPPETYEDLMTLKGDRGGRDVMDRYPRLCTEVVFTDAVQFTDIDTQEDAEYAKNLL
jgi:molybdenum cofactor cytidylyltransferase